LNLLLLPETRRGRDSRIGGNLDFEHGFAALYAVAAFQVTGFDADAVDERSVGRAEIAQETLRRRDFQNAVVARKIAVLRQAKMCIFAAPNHKCFVLFKRKDAPGLRTRYHAECNSHLFKFYPKFPFMQKA
jgi:hypothetical protein